MYIETSYPRKNGDKARLVSPSHAPVKGGQCFQFWYHMYGNSIGTLNVYIKIAGNIGIPVWIRSGNRGNVWKVTQIPITTSSSFNVGALFFCCCICKGTVESCLMTATFSGPKLSQFLFKNQFHPTTSIFFFLLLISPLEIPDELSGKCK